LTAGYGWIDALKDEANLRISDEQFKIRKPEWGADIPATREAYWYRLMYDNVFKPHTAETVKRWIPSWGAPSDPYALLLALRLIIDPVVLKAITPPTRHSFNRRRNLNNKSIYIIYIGVLIVIYDIISI
jgi:hypothetical protein